MVTDTHIRSNSPRHRYTRRPSLCCAKRG